MNRRTFLGAALGGAALSALSLNAAAQRARKPNVVIITTDDQGYGDLSCYGSETLHTPHIDSLARDGMRFTDFYCASPVCTPSRAGLLTGCYPQRVGMSEPPVRRPSGELAPGGVLFPNSPSGLHPGEITIADMLKAEGYATGCVGKWHLGHLEPFLPTRQGFDEYFGIPYSNDMIPACLMRGETIHEVETNQDVLTVRYAEEGRDFIRRHAAEPFFLYIAHSMPHVPLFLSERFAGKSKGGIYGDVIEMIDWSVGEILAELDQRGLRDDTLVVFTTDNGPWLIYTTHGGSAGPLRAGKGSCYEGGMRVPGLMRWPARIPAGSVCGEVATQLDMLPTIAAMTGAAVPADRVIDGKDILPLMSAEAGAKSPHDAFFYYRGDRLDAVRSGDWKLMFAHTKRDENPYGGARPDDKDAMPEALYNLRDDIAESRNVLAEHSGVAERLRTMANDMRKDLGDTRDGVEGSGRRPYGMAPDGMLEAWMKKYVPENPVIKPKGPRAS